MTNSTVEFLRHLSNLGINLETNGDRLRCHAPEGVLNPKLRQEIAGRKTEIMLLLQQAKQVKASHNHLPIQPMSRDGELPLSFAQQQLWFLQQLLPDTHLSNMLLVLRLVGNLNLAAFEQSLREIIHRHEVLRTTFPTVNGKPVQDIAPSVNLTLPVIDWQGLSAQEQTAQIPQIVQSVASKPFELDVGPLVQFTLIQLGEQNYLFMLKIHHIIYDGWSSNIFVRELSQLYQAFTQGLPYPLAKLPIQYADFAVWQRQWLQGDVLQTKLTYWQQKLANVPALLSLPTDKPRPAVQTFQGESQEFILSKDLTLALNQLSQKENVTLFMTLLAAFKILLWRYSGQDDICLGTPIANRNRAETEGVIGFFVNSLVLHTHLGNNPSFRELLVQVRETCLEAYAHQDLPFERLVEALQPERNLSHHPIFQVWFNLLNLGDNQLELAGLSVEPVSIPTAEASKFDLSLYVTEREQGIKLELVYNADLFTSERMKEMQQQFHHLLSQIVAAPDRAIATYSLVTPEAQPLLPDPKIALPEPEYELVTTLFTFWVNHAPEQSALCQESRLGNYGELGQKAQALAQMLVNHGVERGNVVAVYGTASFGLITSTIAVLLSGGVLLTLDPRLPNERQRLMLQEAKAKYILYIESQHLEDQGIWQSLTTIYVNPDTGLAKDALESSSTIPLPEISGDDAAYIFFTSGTTGVPKGVLGCHKGLAHFLNWQRQRFEIRPQDRIAQLTGFSFDVVLRDIFLPLTSGATLCLPAEGENLEPTKILHYLEREQISVLHTVPSLAQSWLANVPSEVSLGNLRWLFLAGEPLKETLVLRWREAFPQAGEIINLYGPTETTLAKCYYQVPARPAVGVQPVGWPLPETQALVFNSHHQPSGIGELGEIVLRTPFSTLGYINATEAENSRFVKNPFRNEPKDWLYYTGDRGRYLPNGSLEIFGRQDHQVKIRGIRIELGEIETVLTQHPFVHQTVVIAREDVPGDRRLVAYVIPNQKSAPTISELRHFLATKLPQYMIPGNFVFLDSLPLTANGKVNRGALPAPSSTSNPDKFVAPRNNFELQLAQIWAKILQVNKVGVQDNFFDLGGHSLLAVYLMTQIKQEFGKDIPIATLFQNPTIEQLAVVVQKDVDNSCWSPLVAIEPKGSKPPFFCVPGAGAYPFYLYDLARCLVPDQPFYSFQANGLDGSSTPIITRVEDTAAQYIQALQAVQPQGPYFLGGHSFGGKVAFEMSQQLLHQGHKVALVAIFDTSAPFYREKTPGVDWDNAQWLIELATAMELEFAKKLDISYETLQALVVEEQLKFLLQRLKMVNILPPDADTTQLDNLVRVFKADIQTNYLPQQIYPTKITLFRASGVSVEELASKFPPEILEDSTWGWGKFSAEPVDIHFVPGEHTTMMKQPHVQVLAERLRDCIQQDENFGQKYPHLT